MTQNIIIDTQQYLTTAQAAQFLGLSEPTLERHRVKGTGPVFHRLGGKLVRYRIADLDAWAKPATSTSEAK
jgi:excisionase family DNA binding protein